VTKLVPHKIIRTPTQTRWPPMPPPTKVIPVCRLVRRHKKEIAKHSYNQIYTIQNTSGDKIGPMAFKGETNNLVQLQYLNLQTKAAVLFLFDKKTTFQFWKLLTQTYLNTRSKLYMASQRVINPSCTKPPTPSCQSIKSDLSIDNHQPSLR